MWNLIWKASVPHKMRIFAWKVVSGALATNLEKNRWHVGSHASCVVCGLEDESTFHAFVACPNVAALWDSMQLEWPLANRVDVQWTGDEWLLHLLADQTERTHDMILLLLWREWHLRNEITPGKSIPPYGGVLYVLE